MPIRINFLAEEQTIEEMRRRDPVKRAIYGVAAALVIMALWLGINQIKVIRSNALLQVQKDEYAKVEKGSQAVEASLRQASEISGKLKQLKQLAIDRFLWAPVLDMFQKTMVKGIQVTHLSASEQYVIVPPVNPPRGSGGKPKPGSSTQKIRLSIDARDFGSQGSPNYSKYMDALSSTDLLKNTVPGPNSVRLRDISQPMIDPSDPTRTVVNFSLDCFLPEKVR